MGPMYIETPYITMDIKTPYITTYIETPDITMDIETPYTIYKTCSYILEKKKKVIYSVNG